MWLLNENLPSMRTCQHSCVIMDYVFWCWSTMAFLLCPSKFLWRDLHMVSFWEKKNSFDQLLNKWRSKIAPEQMHVVGNKRLSKKICISSLLECTRDISSENCKNCLLIRIRERQNYNHRSRGGHAIYRSCYIIFEFYGFYGL